MIIEEDRYVIICKSCNATYDCKPKLQQWLDSLLQTHSFFKEIREILGYERGTGK